MTEINPYSDLWRGEQAAIAELAAAVPPGGTIVEIGTFQGGTAQLLYGATRGKGVKIYTVDCAPQAVAYENLKQTEVQLIVKTSLEAAQAWPAVADAPIDFLFIDGGHMFQDVLSDFNAWLPHLKSRGIVGIHDYDPIERGGVVHFGVQVFMDTLLRLNVFGKTGRAYRLVYGEVPQPAAASISPEACYETLKSLAQQILCLRATAYGGWNLVADDRFAALLKGCLRLEGCREVWPPSLAPEIGQSWLVSAQPAGLPLELLKATHLTPDAPRVIDSLKACYLVGFALKANFEYLYRLSADRRELLRLAQTLTMLESAYGPSTFPERLPAAVNGMEPHWVAQVITQEQVKLDLLARALKTFVDWTP
jgi:hypothetical protein